MMDTELGMLDLLNGTDPKRSWVLALALLFVVSLVVWQLLRLVANTAREINATAAVIWSRGQRVANNTIHIAKAYDIRDGVDALLGRAGHIASAATAIKQHAESCPGCPACFLGHR